MYIPDKPLYSQRGAQTEETRVKDAAEVEPPLRFTELIGEFPEPEQDDIDGSHMMVVNSRGNLLLYIYIP